MEPLRFKPEKKIRNAAVFTGGSFAVAAGLMIFSTYIVMLRAAYQLGCVIALAVGIQIATRFIMSEYEYALDKDNFIVFKTTGKKKTEICNVTLKAAYALYKNTPQKTIESNHGKINMRLNFCQNMRPDNSCVFVFDFNGKKASVSFEYNEAFFAEFQYRMELFKGKKEIGDE